MMPYGYLYVALFRIKAATRQTKQINTNKENKKVNYLQLKAKL